MLKLEITNTLKADRAKKSLNFYKDFLEHNVNPHLDVEINFLIDLMHLYDINQKDFNIDLKLARNYYYTEIAKADNATK